MTHSLEISPRPKVDVEHAAKLAHDLFGIAGTISELSSHQDRNFRIVTQTADVVLKIANKSWRLGALQAQNSSLLYLSQQLNEFTAPVPIPGVNDEYIQTAIIDGDELFVRLITYIDGETLTGERYLAPIVRADLGRLAGQAAKALEGFDHEGLTPGGQWDLMHGIAFVRQYLDSVTEPERRKLIDQQVQQIEAILANVGDSLRIRAIHNDVTDDNTVGIPDTADRIRPNGIIDFGDFTRSWLVGDIAMTAASILRHAVDHPFATMDAIRAYHHEVPLTDHDVTALWPLIVLRGAVLVVAGDHQASLDPDNAAAVEPLEGERRIFDRAASIPFDLAEAVIRATLGLPSSATVAKARGELTHATTLLETPNPACVVDLSVESDALDDGRFTEPGIINTILAERGMATGTAVSRFAEPYLSRTLPISEIEPATIALGVHLSAAAGTIIRAPLDGEISHRINGRVVLTTAAGLIYLDGLSDAPADGTHITAASAIGTLSTGTLWVQVLAEPNLDPAPAFCTPTEAIGWCDVSLDPSPLIGVSLRAPSTQRSELLDRRDRSFARLQEHYYDEPMQIERGWRTHLIDTNARSYLDMVNNVAVVGHGHPRLADAVNKQMRKLNTNSRFHYGAIVEFTERLTALTPPELDTVFLVNSGSEAVDLALHIAQIATDRMDLIAVREAYHGWTLLSDAVTTSLYDNPKALETRPDWIHLVAAPNPYRGEFRGDTAAGDYIAEFNNTVDSMCAQGTPPAAFICEPVFGNAGGVLLPEGYLAATYEAVRRVGGLCIADEVQVGYGRLGHHWWAYQMHDVQPDIITVAKAMGNGQPLGAVITTRAIAEAFGDQGNFFSSAGGSPVSCVVGSTVLDIIKDEGLQHNAATVGDHLIARCSALMNNYPLIGAVHGMGLYLGVELVVDRETREPATTQCAAICDRLRELGVIVQPTGERANVLKMKPPMTLTLAEADFYVDQLERVLRDGW
jgi:4-aminobutyrate aminotransferase-like enzyme/Ser/Thr protein kinase RdoA (MazF antagonist)